MKDANKKKREKKPGDMPWYAIPIIVLVVAGVATGMYHGIKEGRKVRAKREAERAMERERVNAAHELKLLQIEKLKREAAKHNERR
jgi:hypothetical protein